MLICSLILFALLCLCSTSRCIIIVEAIEMEFLILKVNYPIKLPTDFRCAANFSHYAGCAGNFNLFFKHDFIRIEVL